MQHTETGGGEGGGCDLRAARNAKEIRHGDQLIVGRTHLDWILLISIYCVAIDSRSMSLAPWPPLNVFKFSIDRPRFALLTGSQSRHCRML